MSSILPLRLTDLAVTKRGTPIIGPISLELSGDGTTAILGPNGAGKTTLLRAMHGLERLSAGTIEWQLPREEAETRQAYVFQTPIIMRRSVVDNIAYPLMVRGRSKAEARAKASVKAEQVGLAAALQRSARELSGGEKQKLSLARALVIEPDILFLDEPTVNLDGRATREIERILTDAIAGGTRVVITTHDMGQARRLASEIILVVRGRVHERGDAGAFFDKPQTPEGQAFLNGDIID